MNVNVDGSTACGPLPILQLLVERNQKLDNRLPRIDERVEPESCAGMTRVTAR